MSSGEFGERIYLTIFSYLGVTSLAPWSILCSHHASHSPRFDYHSHPIRYTRPLIASGFALMEFMDFFILCHSSDRYALIPSLLHYFAPLPLLILLYRQ